MSKYSDPPLFIRILGFVGIIYFVFQIFHSDEKDKVRIANSPKEKPTIEINYPASSPNIKAYEPETATPNFHSEAGCRQLSDIAANAYTTKSEGHSLQEVLVNIKMVDIPDSQRRVAVEGIVVAIYGDDSLSSRADAYNSVYSACKP